MNKIKIIFLIIIIPMILVIIFILLFKITLKDNNLNKDEYIEIVEPYSPPDYIVKEEYINSLINDERRELWGNWPLTEHFIDKYKNTKVNNDPNLHNFYNEKYDAKELLKSRGHILQEDEIRYIAEGKGKEIYEIVFKFIIKENKIDDIILVFKKKHIDEFGNYTKESLYKIDDEQMYGEQLSLILFPYGYYHQIKKNIYYTDGRTRKDYALTDNFLNKYRDDKDIIEFNTPYNIINDYDNSDYDKKIWSFNIYLEYENLNYFYKYKFLLDENGYLDDIELIEHKITEIYEKEYFKKMYLIPDYNIRALLVKNSDRNNCRLSDKYFELFKSGEKVLIDIAEIVNIKFIYDDNESVLGRSQYSGLPDDIDALCDVYRNPKNKRKIIYNIVLSYGNEDIPCIFNITYNNKYEIDDIKTYIIPSDKRSANENDYIEMYRMIFDE